ncbi:MAG: histidine kinase dimerization/phospho-acceptor domain-containing protein, partial [Cyanobacteria bacterium P01_E01_bin.34]
MSSRFFPSLIDVIWSGSPTPEWLSGTEDSAWKQTIAAMQQLWRDIGTMGVGASCPVAWWPLPDRTRAERARDNELDILPGQRWLFTSNLSVGNLSQPHQIVVPVMPRDALKDEQFFAVVTTAFSAVALKAAHPETGDRGVTFSFEPQVVHRVWRALRTRVQAVRQDSVDLWDAVLEDYPLLPPDYRVLSRFSSLLMMSAHDRLPMPENHPEQQLFLMPPSLDFVEEIPQVRIPNEDKLAKRPISTEYVADERPSKDRSSQEYTSKPENAPPEPLSESEFLRAIAHEVQTPLATIRTLTRLLLRRDDLTPLCRRYVESIERECTEQIDRFGLFFRATELDPDNIRLQATSLTELLQANQPRWTQHVERRGSTFELDIPEDSPSIVSDPNTLDAMLTGVIDRISRGAPAGSHIVAKIVHAGEQVKLQFQVSNDEFDCGDSHVSTPLRALGQLLVVQPETGALSLSTSMTQQLF